MLEIEYIKMSKMWVLFLLVYRLVSVVGEIDSWKLFLLLVKIEKEIKFINGF